MNKTTAKTLFVVNPVSGNGRGLREWTLMAEHLSDWTGQFDVRITKFAMEAVKITNEALRNGYKHIIAVGGDGTINEVANGQFFGGGMRIAPLASVDDGYLDVIIAKDIGKIDLMANLFRVYKGNHLSHPKIEMARGQKVDVFSNDQIFLEVDGETAGQGDVEFKVLPEGINLLV